MSYTYVLYVLVFLVGVFGILTVMMGVEKSVKVILGNYFITAIVFAMGIAINGLIVYFGQHEVNILGFGSENLILFFQNAKLTLSFIVYILLTFLWYKYATISIQMPLDDFKKHGLMIIVVPLCVVGALLSLMIILFGDVIGDIAWIQNVIPDNSQLQNIVFNIPLWIMLHGIAVFILSLNINFSRKREMIDYTDTSHI